MHNDTFYDLLTNVRPAGRDSEGDGRSAFFSVEGRRRRFEYPKKWYFDTVVARDGGIPIK